MEEIKNETILKKEEALFTKEQILASEKYANRRDLADALLEDGKSYKMETVDKMMENFLKGKVK